MDIRSTGKWLRRQHRNPLCLLVRLYEESALEPVGEANGAQSAMDSHCSPHAAKVAGITAVVQPVGTRRNGGEDRFILAAGNQRERKPGENRPVAQREPEIV